jgi:hypothetical protein
VDGVAPEAVQSREDKKLRLNASWIVPYAYSANMEFWVNVAPLAVASHNDCSPDEAPP